MEQTIKTAKSELGRIISKISENLDKYGFESFPLSASANSMYEFTSNNSDWTEGFWTGMVWLAYQYSKDDKFKKAGLLQTKTYETRFDKNVFLEHHDLGFLYIYSCIRCYELTSDETAKEYALKAADKLMTRYNEKAGVIQAWGDLTDPQQSGRFIIDCLMNIPLLFWASDITGDKTYFNAALTHATAASEYIIRPDNSTFHTFHMDVITGKPKFGTTHQGFSDTSCWARGQAWGVYGFALAYKHTKDERFLDSAYKVTDYYIDHLPEDYVPYWDLIFSDKDGNDQPRDSSAAAIVLCGLLEQLPYADEERVARYLKVIKESLKSLSTKYTTANKNSNGVLLHATYALPQGLGIDECNIWGDYYYMEGLMHLLEMKNI